MKWGLNVFVLTSRRVLVGNPATKVLGSDKEKHTTHILNPDFTPFCKKRGGTQNLIVDVHTRRVAFISPGRRSGWTNCPCVKVAASWAYAAISFDQASAISSSPTGTGLGLSGCAQNDLKYS